MTAIFQTDAAINRGQLRQVRCSTSTAESDRPVNTLIISPSRLERHRLCGASKDSRPASAISSGS